MEVFPYHKSDVMKGANRANIKLSAHAWGLRDQQNEFDIEWDFIEQATSFNPAFNLCFQIE